MARPKPTVLLKSQVGEYTKEIVTCQGVYAVFYRGKPLQYREKLPWGSFKYLKSTYVNKGNAIRLANKLNKMYSTDDFTCETLFEC